MSKFVSACVMASLTGLAAPGVWAQTGVLDFEDIVCARKAAQCELGDQYVARGFALRHTPAVDEPLAAGLLGIGPTWKPNRKGSTALMIRSCEAQVTLMANDNALFDAQSIELAEVNGQGPSSVEFVGQKGDGTEVRQSFQLDGKAGWQKFSFSAGFRELSALQWSQGDCINVQPHMVDQLELARSAKP
jgi:hypothetical protein